MRARTAAAGRVPGLDGLRGIAALSVVVLHTSSFGEPTRGWYALGWWNRNVLPHLAAGVPLFFVLSGFLLYRPYARAALDGERRPRLARYVRQRFWRIAPAYIALLAFCGYVLGTTQVRDAHGALVTGSLRSRPWLALSNAFLVQGYAPRTFATGIGPAWSLCVEVAFYVMLPALGALAIALARRSRSRRRRLVSAAVPVVVMLAIGWSGRAVGAFLLLPHARGPSPGWDADWASVVAHSIAGNADLFAPGMALAIAWHEIAAHRLAPWRWWPAVAAGTGAAAAFVAHQRLAFELGATHDRSYYLYDPAVSVAAACLVALVALPSAARDASAAHRRLVAVFDSRVLAGIGAVSYSLYLVHTPLIEWLREQGVTRAGTGGFAMTLALVVAASLAVAALTYLLVEQPAMRHRGRRAPRIVASTAR